MPAMVKAETKPRAGIVVLVLVAVAAATFGIVQLVDTWTAPASVGHEGTLDGLHTRIDKAGWVDLEDMAKGMAPGMPMNQMQGMPDEGDGRVEVKVTVVNATSQTHQFLAAEEFALRAEKGDKRWTPSADTFGDLPRLAPRNAVSGLLFFDMPPDEVKDTTVWLEWKRDGGSAALSVSLSGTGGGMMDHSEGEMGSGGK
ncbi:hypothetical protein [Actinophytocola sp.]|uniref:hypothetical protein n=1 Tax=Actinophytocola sp. TaxID=1872138 RepID=UPI002ED53F62